MADPNEEDFGLGALIESIPEEFRETVKKMIGDNIAEFFGSPHQSAGVSKVYTNLAVPHDWDSVFEAMFEIEWPDDPKDEEINAAFQKTATIRDSMGRTMWDMVRHITFDMRANGVPEEKIGHILTVVEQLVTSASVFSKAQVDALLPLRAHFPDRVLSGLVQTQFEGPLPYQHEEISVADVVLLKANSEKWWARSFGFEIEPFIQEVLTDPKLHD